MEKAFLTHILTSALLTILMLSCSGCSRYHALLDRADSLMAEHPDSAYALLTSIDSADMSHFIHTSLYSAGVCVVVESRDYTCIN